jgi:threonine dehydratase
MIAGIAAIVKALKPDIKIIGVEPTGANAMVQVGCCRRCRLPLLCCSCC